MKKINIIAILALFIFGCKPKVDKEVTFSAGDLDFSNTIYFGDNLLSGYTNGGLYENGQENSVAKILSTQFSEVGGSEVTQPTLSGTGTGHYSIESYSGGNFTTIFNEASAISGNTSVNLFECAKDSVLPVYSSTGGSFTNLSCPTLKVSSIHNPNITTVNNDSYNSYLARIGSENTSYAEQIIGKNPSFFICAFGLSDVLDYADNGASCGDPTPKDLFKLSYDSLLSKLTNQSPNGVLCEIPNIQKLPYLNANFSFDEDIYIESKQHINNGMEIRKFVSGEDKFLRTAFEKVGVDGYGLSDTMPIKDEDVLDKIEIDDIAGVIFNYNLDINSLGTKYNLPVVSMENYLLAEEGLLGDSIVLDGTNTKIDYKLGSAISLDGIFPTPKGSAAIANKFITEINNHYEVKIPLANINDYNGLMLP